MGVVGVLMILFGSYFVMENDPNKHDKNIFSQFFANKGVLLRIAALVLSATEAIFLKRALLLSSPLITFLFWCILGLPIAYIAMTFMLKQGIRNEIIILKQKRINFLLLATTTGLMQLSTLYTFGALQVGYSLALFQISTLLSVLFGYKFFQEKNIIKKLFGAIIMVLGAMLIITFGSHS
jgi:drug/metabolite transporter (DMT)-like permease